MLINNSFLFKLQLKFPWLAKLITFSNGLIPDEESDKDYWFGAEKISSQILVEDGNWTPYLPKDERQSGRYVETMGCTGYALLNCLEMIAKCKYGHDWNKSDRFTNEMTGTTGRGNSMRRVLDITRKDVGVVPEESWSWDRDTFNWNKYYDVIPRNIEYIGEAWLKQFEISYEKVQTNKQLMKEAIKRSPLYVSGYAWAKRGETYRSYGQANHCFCILHIDDEGYPWALDSYPPFIKKLDKDFYFGACYRIELYDKKAKYNTIEIKKLRERGFKFIMRADRINGGRGEVYELTEENKLRELTDQDKKDEAVRQLSNMKELTGVSEVYFGKLLR